MPPRGPRPPKKSAASSHTLSIGKTRRLRAAELCPGGRDPRTGVCDPTCPSLDECVAGRFHPEA